jgi:large subunit ribosomal protein L4
MIKQFDVSSKNISEIENPSWFSSLPEVVDTYALNLYRHVYLSNQRQSNAMSKTKAMVSGGGRKPYSQKGTGRARAGSIRSPIWRGGGKAHGPTGNENYNLKLNKKFKYHAFRNALALKLLEGSISLLKGLESDKIVKTKDFADIYEFLGSKKPLILTPFVMTNLLTSSRNIDNKFSIIQTIDEVNVYDVIVHDHLFIVDEEASHQKLLLRINR